MGTSLATSVETQQKATQDRVKGMLNGYAQRAVEILQELAEYAENDRIRLSAVNSILDRAGIVAPQEVKITASPEEHAIIKSEAEETMRRISENVKAAATRRAHSLEAVMVHEGEER
jgi:hypothetical protein